MDAYYIDDFGCWCLGCDANHDEDSELCARCEIAGCTLTEAKHA